MRTQCVNPLSSAKKAALNPGKPICPSYGAKTATRPVPLRPLYCRTCRPLDDIQDGERYVTPLVARGLSLALAGA
jgi:hypothetical protein